MNKFYVLFLWMLGMVVASSSHASEWVDDSKGKSSQAKAVHKPVMKSMGLNLSIDEFIEQGHEQYKLGNYEESVVLLDKAAVIEPENATVPYYLGLTYQGMTQFDEAAQQFSKAVTLDVSLGDAWSHLGEMLYREAKYQEAKEALENAEKYGARAAYTSYMKALAHQQLFEFDDAIVAFKRAKQLQVGFSQKVDYALGMIYSGQKKLKQAKEFFRSAVAIDADSVVGVYADFELKRLNKPAARAWHANVAYNFQYDDNVVLIPDGASSSLLPTGKSDFEHVVSLNLNYQAEPSGRFNMRTDLIYYRNTHQKLKYMDLDVLGLSVSPSYKTSLGVVTVSTSGNYILLGANKYMHTLGVNPSFGFDIGKRQYGSFMAGVQKSSYLNQSLPVAAEDRNSIKYSGGYSHFVYLHDKVGFVKLGYNYGVENTKGNNWDVVTQDFSASMAYPLFYGSVIQLGGNYFLQDYQHVNTFFSRSRQDKILNLTAMLTKKFKLGSVNLNYAHSRGKSNIAAYTYTRNIIGLGLNVSY